MTSKLAEDILSLQSAMLTRSLVHLFCAVVTTLIALIAQYSHLFFPLQIIYIALQKDGEVVLADAIPRKVDDSCTFFYKPCECYTFLPQGEMQITCRNLSPQQVFDVFTQDSIPSSDITYFVFEMSDPNQTYIPANLLGSRKVLSSINLQWTGADTEGLLMINPDAFRSSDESLLYLIIDGFNVQNLEWSFLEGFDSLLALQMSNLVDVKKLASSLTNFGSNLTHLYAYNCTELTDIPGVISALRVAEFSNTTIGIESASKILTKLLKVNETLERLVFDYAPIQIIPGEMNMFSNTEFLAIKNAEISIVQEGAFNVSPSIFSPQHIRQISLSNNKITKIMPGAFGSKEK